MYKFECVSELFSFLKRKLTNTNTFKLIHRNNQNTNGNFIHKLGKVSYTTCIIFIHFLSTVESLEFLPFSIIEKFYSKKAFIIILQLQVHLQFRYSTPFHKIPIKVKIKLKIPFKMRVLEFLHKIISNYPSYLLLNFP
jgi:hypothetical protein